MNQEMKEYQSVTEATDFTRLAGKYLTFILGRESYGLDILKVQEIISLGKITRVPRSPAFVKGIINLRGKIIPVVDLRLKFGMAEAEYTNKSSIIVVDLFVNDQSLAIGMIVDTVREVMHFEAAKLEPSPKYGLNVDTDFVKALGKLNEEVVILIDIDKVLSKTDGQALAKVAIE